MADAEQRSGLKRIGPEHYLDLLRGQIDITRVPFSDRGSRLVIQQEAGKSCLLIRLAERLTVLNPNPEAYLLRPAFIQELQFVDENGEALAFEAWASPDCICCKTRLGEFGIVFQDANTIAIGLPAGIAAGIKFNLNSVHFCRSGTDGKIEPVRVLVFATNCSILKEKRTAQPGGSTIEYILCPSSDGTILLRIGESDTPLGIGMHPFSSIQKSTTARWQAWFERVPPVAEVYAAKYAYAWWVMANNLISPLGCIAYETMAPSKASYVGLWLWDSALHALAYRHVDPELARNQIRAFLTAQRNDGMLPDAIFDEGLVFEIDHPIHGEVSKPPILTWAALKLHENAPDLNFFQEIYAPLARCNNWWFEKNSAAEGLVQYNHPYSSGLDDSPLWDHGLPATSPDLNTYLYIQMQSLACIADALGLREDAIQWERKAEALLEQMNTILWDEDAGLFRALSGGQPIPVITPLNLLPLWTGRLSEGIIDRLLANLTDTQKFWGRYMLPTVSRDDPAYDPETMWRGPVWANINYFFIEALKQIGKTDLARDLRDATLDMIMSQPSISEYYNAETGEPPARSVPTFGWTAAVFIDLAIQATSELNAHQDEASVTKQIL